MGFVPEGPTEIVTTAKILAIKGLVQKKPKVHDDVDSTCVLNIAELLQHFIVQAERPRLKTRNWKTKTEAGKGLTKHFPGHDMWYDMIRKL